MTLYHVRMRLIDEVWTLKPGPEWFRDTREITWSTEDTADEAFKVARKLTTSGITDLLSVWVEEEDR
jgi:hypothetical protein